MDARQSVEVRGRDDAIIPTTTVSDTSDDGA